MRPGAARPGQDGHPAGGIEHMGGSRQRLLIRAHHRRDRPDRHRAGIMRRILEEHLAGHHDHSDPAALQRRPHRHLQHTRQLGRDADQFAVHAALAEQLLRVRFLEIAAADLLPRDLRGDRQHRYPAAVGVEQAVDQVQVAGPATARAHCHLPGQRRLGGGREPGGLLMSHVLPGDCPVAAQRIGEPVQRVAGNAVYPPHPGRFQRRHHDLSHRSRHDPLLRSCRLSVTVSCYRGNRGAGAALPIPSRCRCWQTSSRSSPPACACTSQTMMAVVL